MPLIDKLREELAVDIQKQKALEQELNIPKFEKDEQVDVADEDVSDEEEEADGEDDANNKKKAEQQESEVLGQKPVKGKRNKEEGTSVHNPPRL